MDPHFHEYLAAVAGMQEIYGEPAEEGRSDFHDESAVAEAGETVLLAPAAASFDQYPDFERRGEDFTRLVQSLPGIAPA